MIDMWKKEPFDSCIVPVHVDRKRQIKSRDYLPAGKYPIVDQGEGLIAGWTNNDAAVISGDLPCVIFGDHTRTFKYVNFPFVLGADGTKVLKPRGDINPRYFYFHLLSLDIPSRGYSRHFRLLKEKKIALPPPHEQKKIATVLLKIQRAVEMQDRIIQSLRDLKKSTMQYLFIHGTRGEKTKMSEIGEIPESWEVKRLGDIASISAGGTPSRANPAYWQNGKIPWVKTGEINYHVITATEECITQLGLENSAAKLFPAGTLLLAMYGQGITRGRVGLLSVEAATNQACAAIIPMTLSTRFLYHYLTWSYDRLRSRGHGAQQANLNAKIVAGFPVAIPSPDEQARLTRVLASLDNKVLLNESKKSILQDLFKTTLNELMTGEIRVDDLDIDVSEVEYAEQT